jgi:hypothetical protein
MLSASTQMLDSILKFTITTSAYLYTRHSYHPTIRCYETYPVEKALLNNERLNHFKSRDSSVGIALGYRLDDRGTRVRFPGTRGSYLGSKAAGAWSWPLNLHLVPRSRMRGAIHLLPQYVFMAWCLVKHRDNFTFTFINHFSSVTMITQSWLDFQRHVCENEVRICVVKPARLFQRHHIAKLMRRHSITYDLRKANNTSDYRQYSGGWRHDHIHSCHCVGSCVLCARLNTWSLNYPFCTQHLT